MRKKYLSLIIALSAISSLWAQVFVPPPHNLPPQPPKLGPAVPVFPAVPTNPNKPGNVSLTDAESNLIGMYDSSIKQILEKRTQRKILEQVYFPEVRLHTKSTGATVTKSLVNGLAAKKVAITSEQAKAYENAATTLLASYFKIVAELLELENQHAFAYQVNRVTERMVVSRDEQRRIISATLDVAYFYTISPMNLATKYKDRTFDGRFFTSCTVTLLESTLRYTDWATPVVYEKPDNVFELSNPLVLPFLDFMFMNPNVSANTKYRTKITGSVRELNQLDIDKFVAENAPAYWQPSPPAPAPNPTDAEIHTPIPGTVPPPSTVAPPPPAPPINIPFTPVDLTNSAPWGADTPSWYADYLNWYTNYIDWATNPPAIPAGVPVSQQFKPLVNPTLIQPAPPPYVHPAPIPGLIFPGQPVHPGSQPDGQPVPHSPPPTRLDVPNVIEIGSDGNMSYK